MAGRLRPRSLFSFSPIASSCNTRPCSSMSSDLVISCDRVGKAFQLYMRRNDQLKQAIFGHWKQFYHQHWVLRDITFKVRRGERIGVIGRNGAGKTTLLQIICGITLPTHGSVQVNGRVAPILALGAGFDHELTGRENALTGGAILGMRRATVEARLAAIAAFAGIGDFLYQPVKLYSSGMAAPLAFAVCAHAADILIVDEALSVGDEAFGAKCDAFIKDFAEHGTILVARQSKASRRRRSPKSRNPSSFQRNRLHGGVLRHRKIRVFTLYQDDGDGKFRDDRETDDKNESRIMTHQRFGGNEDCDMDCWDREHGRGRRRRSSAGRRSEAQDKPNGEKRMSQGEERYAEP